MRFKQQLSFQSGVTVRVKPHRLLLLLMFMSAPFLGQQKVAFSGRVAQGESFVKPIGKGLAFAVRSQNGHFTISVEKSARAGKAGGDNLASCVTPPYHGPNALTIEGWELGSERTKEEMAEAKRRMFQFVMNEADQKEACDEMKLEVYGPEKRNSDGTIVLGHENYRAPAMGKGVLRIVNYQLHGGGTDKSPEVDWLSFRAEIELPVKTAGAGR